MPVRRRFRPSILRHPDAGLLALAISSSTVLVSRVGHPQSIIRSPGNHPDYSVEGEPHALFGAFDPPGDTVGTGYGAGLRLTIPVVRNGFVSTLNNSVGISFGLDWLHYQGDSVTVGPCAQWAPGPANTQVCTLIGAPSGGPANYFFLPVALQWNFWLHERFSAFGEPGVLLYYRKAEHAPDGDLGLSPLFELGGRWHFSEVATLTFRLGYPTLSLGISFLL